MSGLSALGAGGGLSASASSSATSGPATGGNLGVYIQGITTGGTNAQGTGGTNTNTILIAALAFVAALLVMKRNR